MPNERDRLYSSLNLWDIDKEGTILGMSCEAAALYRLSPQQDATLLDDVGGRNFVRAAQQVAAALPSGCSLSFFLDVERADSPALAPLRERVETTDGVVREILDARAATLERAKARKTALYLCLAVHPTDFLRLPLFARTVFPFRAGEALRKKMEDSVAKLKNLEGVVLGQLGAGAGARRLSAEEAGAFYWRHLNPAKAGAGIGPAPRRQYLSQRSQLAVAAAADEADHFWADGFSHLGLSLHSFGEYVELGGIDRLITKLPTGSRLAVHFMAVDLEAALDRAKSQARSSEGLAFLQGRKNYEAQAKAGELDELVTLVRSSGERLLIASVCAVLRDMDRERLRRRANRALTLFREALGAEALTEDLEHKRVYFACLPFGAVLAPRRHTLTSEACAHLAPLSAPWEGCGGSGIAFRTREGGTVVLDPFDGDTPRHGIVIGSTGSGKSFTMNYLASSLYAADPRTHFIIVDVGGSYQRLCEVLNGRYYEIKLSREYALNVFPPREAVLDSGGEMDPDLAGYLSLLIEKMLEGRTGQTRRRILEHALRRLYKSDDRRPPFLGRFVEILKELPGDEQDRREAGEMARELRLFTEGSYAAIFNSTGGLDPFAGRMTVFDLAKFKEHKLLQGLLITVIGFGLARRMAQRDLRKVFILDEGWEFFDDDNASELVSRLYRTARKFNGTIISVSQSPCDFLKSKASTAMLANSYWKAVLRLDMGHEELSGFGLNARQIEAVKSLAMKKRAYSELFLLFGDRSRVVRVEPTSLEYWISTTNAQECAMEAELRGRNLGKPRLEILKELAFKEPVCAT